MILPSKPLEELCGGALQGVQVVASASAGVHQQSHVDGRFARQKNADGLLDIDIGYAQQRAQSGIARLPQNAQSVVDEDAVLATQGGEIGDRGKRDEIEFPEQRIALAANRIRERFAQFEGHTCASEYWYVSVTVATSLGAYPTFNFHVAGFGGRLVTTPYVNDREDPESLLALAKKEQARLLFLANPDNPMGSWWDGATVEGLIARLPANCLLCLDEAYCEFAPAGTTPPIDVSNPQVIRFRTFSKAYGMAGARVGYAIGEASVIKSFDKIRNHFGVNRIAQAGALAALADDAHLGWVVDRVAASRDRIAAIGRANGLAPLPSATNFVTMDCGRDGAYARRLLAELINRDVFVRMPGVAPQDRCIRVSAGTQADLDVFEAMLPEALKAAQ